MEEMRIADLKVIQILAKVAMRLWAISGAAVFACFLLYWFYGGLFAFLLLVFAVTGILYHAEDHLLYHPEVPSHSRIFVPVPSMYGLPYESITVRSGDGISLHMFFIRHPGERSGHIPTIVFLHGNAGNMGHRLQNTAGLYHNLQCNVLMLEYRGYGLSSGSPSEDGICMDARAAIDYLYTRHDINHSEIVLFGRSLGGAVAIDVAARFEYSERIWCLVIENTFTSIPDMAKVLIAWKPLNYLPICFYKNQFLSSHKITCVTMPALFISGQADTLVPPHMMKYLHSRCGSAIKHLCPIPGGTHNETWGCTGYYQVIANFLANVRENRTHTRAPSKSQEQVFKPWAQVQDV